MAYKIERFAYPHVSTWALLRHLFISALEIYTSKQTS